MLNSILSSSAAASSITITDFLLCAVGSLVLGVLIACLHMYRNRYSKNFIMTLTILPVIIQTIIMLVNGNLGTGVAVMGAFSLVRFRSLPGNSREISSIFLAMGAGLAAGMGYLGISFILLLIIAAATVLFIRLPFGQMNTEDKDLRITIPENLDYNGLFDEVFSKYTLNTELIKVKTVNMGSLYELHYQIVLKQKDIEKEFIDELRCRNGNLNISCGKVASEGMDL